ncbi:SH3 domain-containing protein [Aureimonas leprariae]|uniref:SH3 domain-containing protein n=1 Tax=Plantimonas leprariae TaxID=2615207 RepID=A0A7V7PN84_9HYPH|nr:SH3 domain-containing protein [Aureimonas leprariae]KAB0678836.1 SH3 domain-containing protein [Aureimonas leprariae]
MNATGKRRSPSGGRAEASPWKRALIRTAVWIVAIPVLCATVIVGGAVPLYLLLPDAKPAASDTTVADAQPAKPPVKVASVEPKQPAKPDEPAPAASSDAPAEAVEDAPAVTDAPAAEEAAPPAAAEASAEPEVATVVPTPRPEPPRPAVSDEKQVASLAPPPAQPEPPRDEPAAPAADRGGRGAVILRNVTLRAGPHGRELGTLKQGTPVSVGRCDEWCEVRGPNGSGWIHSSFLVDRMPERRDRGVATRQVERREAAQDRDPDWLDEGTRYDRDDGPVVIRRPQWTDEDGRPRAVRRYAPAPRDDEYYDPYY